MDLRKILLDNDYIDYTGIYSPYWNIYKYSNIRIAISKYNYNTRIGTTAKNSISIDKEFHHNDILEIIRYLSNYDTRMNKYLRKDKLKILL